MNKIAKLAAFIGTMALTTGPSIRASHAQAKGDKVIEKSLFKQEISEKTQLEKLINKPNQKDSTKIVESLLKAIKLPLNTKLEGGSYGLKKELVLVTTNYKSFHGTRTLVMTALNQPKGTNRYYIGLHYKYPGNESTQIIKGEFAQYLHVELRDNGFWMDPKGIPNAPNARNSNKPINSMGPIASANLFDYRLMLKKLNKNWNMGMFNYAGTPYYGFRGEGPMSKYILDTRAKEAKK